MVRSHHPAVKKAKRLCIVVAFVALGLHFLSFKVPALRTFGNSQVGWDCVGIVFVILAIIAIRAIVISR